MALAPIYLCSMYNRPKIRFVTVWNNCIVDPHEREACCHVRHFHAWNSRNFTYWTAYTLIYDTCGTVVCPYAEEFRRTMMADWKYLNRCALWRYVKKRLASEWRSRFRYHGEALRPILIWLQALFSASFVRRCPPKVEVNSKKTVRLSIVITISGRRSCPALLLSR